MAVEIDYSDKGLEWTAYYKSKTTDGTRTLDEKIDELFKIRKEYPQVNSQEEKYGY